MLTVAKVTAGGGAAYAAYLEGRSQAPEQGDYYLRDGERVEAPGRWVLGAGGAAALGVDPSAPVEGGAFRSVMAVRHPVSGEPLRRVGANGEAVVAIDATFSAPKSVSAVWALSSPELRASIEAAQERAADRALEHAVEFVPMVRRRVDASTVVRERAREVLASSWQHTTARAVEGRAPDPQLHSHVLVHGALRSDGKVVAVESRAWMVHQRELGAAYRSELAAQLRGLGFEIERGTGRGGRYFEVAGVPAELMERWSSRHRQVHEAIELRLAEKRAALTAEIERGGPGATDAAERLEALERSGRLMPAEERRFAISSRAAKGSLQTAGDLDRAWWETAVGYGFDSRTVEALRERGRTAPRGERELESGMLERLVEFDATFAEREARAVAFEAAADLGPRAGLAALERVEAQGKVLRLADGRQTTRAHRSLERAVVASVERVASERTPPLPAAEVDAELARLGRDLVARGVSLAPEQERAVRAACGDRRLAVIVGQAGTGKSTALLAVARTHERHGQRVVVTSTAAQAAERLARELRDGGVQANGYSTTALRANVESGRLDLDTGVTVLHDEAALASTREQAWLLSALDRGGARLVAIGDPRQSQAVGAGGLWSELERVTRDHGALVELSRIVRAQDPSDRRCQALWRSGQHERALSDYRERGRLVLDAEHRRAEDLALDGAQADRQARRSTLVVAQTSNDHLDALNACAQAIRIEHGELGAQGIALAGRPYELRPGDQVMVRSGIRHEQLGVVRNGVAGEVRAVDRGREQATLRLTDGREGVFAREQLDHGQVRLSYVCHPFAAQGITSETTHVIAGPLSTAEGSYVGLTRARERTHVYAATDQLDLRAGATTQDVLASLAEQLGRTEPQVPSISLPLAHEQRLERAHAEQATAASQVTPAERIAKLRVERDRLREVVRSFPRDAAGRAERLEADVERFRLAAASEREQAERYRAEFEGLGRLARRGDRGQELRARAATSDGFAQASEQARRHAAAQLADVHAGPDSPSRWHEANPDAAERLKTAEQAFQRSVDTEAARTVAAPGPYITVVLGERPGPERADERNVWDQAARAVESYRIAHDVSPDEASALGPQPDPQTNSWEQRGDWRGAGERVLEAREQLGLDNREYGPLEERLARIDGLLPEHEREQQLDRGHGIDL